MTRLHPVTPSASEGEVSRWNTLRIQFMSVVFALTFFPNLAMTLMITQGQLDTALLLWTLLVGALCAGLGYYLSGLLLRPLLRLRSEAEDGDFSGVHSDDPAEVRDLRSAFTGLLERLNTEQMRRSAFMATLVHDLKTPLIATGHLIRLLVGESLSRSERQEVGEQMLGENDRLLALVQQMADAHRFEREDVRLSLQMVAASPLLHQIEQRLTERAEQRGIRVQVLGSAEVLADTAALERALGNLSENALRYARSRIYLLALEQDGEYWLGVADDGPGLSRPLNELAQPFNAQPMNIGGQQYTAGTAGLGLFIARRIAEAHGGSLQARTGTLGEVLPALLPQLLPEFLPPRTETWLAGLGAEPDNPEPGSPESERAEIVFNIIALVLPAAS